MVYNFEKFEAYDAVAVRRSVPVQSNGRKSSSQRLSAAMKQSTEIKKAAEKRTQNQFRQDSVRQPGSGRQQDSVRQPGSNRRQGTSRVAASNPASIYSFSGKETKQEQPVVTGRAVTSRVPVTSRTPVVGRAATSRVPVTSRTPVAGRAATSRVPVTSQTPVAGRAVTSRVQSKSKKSIWSQFSVRSIVLCLLGVFAVFAVMINGQMQLTELADQITTSRTYLQDGENRYTNLNLDAERRFNSDAEKIHQYAESHGMQKMGKHQLEGFEMTQGDKVEVLAKVDTDDSLWEAAKEWFDNLLS